MKSDELKAFRVARMVAAVKHLSDGNQAAFGTLLGYKSGAYVRQMIAGQRPITEKTVAAIEALRGMEGWFRPDPSSTHEVREPVATSTPRWPFAAITPKQFDNLLPEQQALVESFVSMLISLNATTERRVRRQPA